MLALVFRFLVELRVSPMRLSELGLENIVASWLVCYPEHPFAKNLLHSRGAVGLERGTQRRRKNKKMHPKSAPETNSDAGS